MCDVYESGEILRVLICKRRCLCCIDDIYVNLAMNRCERIDLYARDKERV